MKGKMFVIKAHTWIVEQVSAEYTNWVKSKNFELP